jgi:hypothetical protein
MLVASLVVVIGLVGLLLYGFAANPKLQKIGEDMFLAAIFAICFGASAKLFVLLGR